MRVLITGITGFVGSHLAEYMLGLGAEVLTEIGMAIKAGSPCAHTFVITHCNGSAGYLPIKDAYVQDGYEVKSSRFAPQAADIVIREAIRLLQDL